MANVSSIEVPDFEDTKIATIIVGKDKKKWRIPMSLLCFHSGYFRSALKGGFDESKAKRVELLDEEPAVFELVVEWLYTHNVGEHLPFDGCEEECAKIGKLLDTWVLAEYLQIPRLQNTIIKSMSQLITDMATIPLEEFNRVCEIVGRDSPLWTWMGECAVWMLTIYDDFYEECIEESPKHLLANIILTQRVKNHIPGDECPINSSYLVKELVY